MPVPNYSDLFNPTLEAIRRLGGSATVAERNAEVANIDLQAAEVEVEENWR